MPDLTQDLSDDSASASDSTSDADSWDTVIDDLEAKHPGLKDRLVEEKNGADDLRRFVNIYINDEDVRFMGGLEAPLSDGDQVVVLPAVAGGAR